MSLFFKAIKELLLCTKFDEEPADAPTRFYFIICDFSSILRDKEINHA